MRFSTLLTKTKKAILPYIKPTKAHGIAFTVAFLIAVSGTFAWNMITRPSGDDLTAWFPESVSIVAEWQGNSASSKNLKKITEKFAAAKLEDEVINTQDREIYTHLQAIAGEYPHIATALTFNSAADATTGFSFVMQIADKTAFDTALADWKTKGLITPTSYGFESQGKSLFFAQKGELFLGANSEEALSAMGKGNSIASAYKAATADLSKDRIGTIFFNPIALQKSKYPGASEGFSQVAIAITPESDGFAFQSLAKADASKLAASDIHLDAIPNTTQTLIGKLPASAPILYYEGYDLPTMLSMMKDGSGTSLLDMAKSGLKGATGLTWEEKVAPWLSEHYAVLIDAGKVLPNITLAANASKNPELAKEFLTVIDSFLSIGLLSMGPNGAALTRGDLLVNSEKFTSWMIDPLKLPDGTVSTETANLLVDFRFSYGVTKDGTFLVSTNPDLAEYGSKTVQESTEVASIFGKVPSKNQGLFFLSPKNITVAVNLLKKRITALETIAPRAEMFLQLLEPVSGVISGNSATATKVEGTGFVEIQ